ncbi:MAG: glycoside hydrolase family 31 protein [Planctomycetota bacterium]|nr:glycoside hydrolase family 31 protein [Planctomycetota bacterium]
MPPRRPDQHEARDEPVGEMLGQRTARFHASADARDNALPSYALLAEPAALGPLPPVPADFPVRPAFSAGVHNHAARIAIAPGTSLYATGECTGPLLRNGRRTVAWNFDAYAFDDTSAHLYQSHPWVLALRADGSAFGLLADTTYRCEIDAACDDPLAVQFRAEGPAFPVIVIDAPSPRDVLRELARLTGAMPLPPRWALGYHQCRYSYYPDAEVRRIARGFREHRIPCDAIWLDIDYMEGFRAFTVDAAKFPDPRALTHDLAAAGFRSVWMIDPGLKHEPHHAEPAPITPDDALATPSPPCSARVVTSTDPAPPAPAISKPAELAAHRARLISGDEHRVWVTRADGSPYTGEVWPGPCLFPDFTAPHVRQWWGTLHPALLAHGPAGLWNDMNEPAVFGVASKTMPLDARHAGDPGMITPAGTPQGPDRAREGAHARYHNVYGMQMIRATRDALAAARPHARPFVLTRANYIGGQRYGATWTGDNTANWYHLDASISMVLNLALSGQPFSGPDIGGFIGNGNAALFARWMGLGALLPFCRAHTAVGTIQKEPWAFDERTTSTCRRALQRRYRLLPYLYTVFRDSSLSGLPVARPVFFADPADPALRAEDDAFLLGDDLLVVAATAPGAASRSPSLPRGVWREIDPAHDPDLPRLFIRAGAIIPCGPDLQWSDQHPLDPLTLLVSLDEHGHATGDLYEDAGDGLGYQHAEFRLTRYHAAADPHTHAVTIHAHRQAGEWTIPHRALHVRIISDAGVVERTGTDGHPLRVPLDPSPSGDSP